MGKVPHKDCVIFGTADDVAIVELNREDVISVLLENGQLQVVTTADDRLTVYVCRQMVSGSEHGSSAACRSHTLIIRKQGTRSDIISIDDSYSYALFYNRH
jgi:hypothetical protein